MLFSNESTLVSSVLYYIAYAQYIIHDFMSFGNNFALKNFLSHIHVLGVFCMSNKAKANFIALSLRKNMLSFIFCLFTICLIIFSKHTISSAKNGLSLWANSVIPSLLPFFIATELLLSTDAIYKLGKSLDRIMRPVFNVPGEGSFALLMGIISGYPIGAKIVTDLRERVILTKTEAERLLAFTNNSGPLFILGTVRDKFIWRY